MQNFQSMCHPVQFPASNYIYSNWIVLIVTGYYYLDSFDLSLFMFLNGIGQLGING